MTGPTAAPGWTTGIRALVRWLERFPMAVFQLLFRICPAVVFWDSGMTKIPSWDTTVLLFENEYRVPLLPAETAAMLAVAIELSCPVLLVIGLATRVATLPMLAMTAVIQVFVYPESWGQHLTWAAMLLFVLTRGPGPISLDRVLARRWSLSG